MKIGLELLKKQKKFIEAGKRVGLLVNQASTDSGFVHSKKRVADLFGDRLTCLFSPQHGFYSEKQDNMIESAHGVDSELGIPIYSLYGETRKPTQEMFEKIDTLLIDIVDVGTRVYTFLYTMAYCMEVAAIAGKQVVVLDRPNPIGGIEVEGNILKKDLKSFVGLFPIPMRHGMTFGELALYINNEHGIGCDLKVVKMEGWKRDMYFVDTGLPWTFPSPNMPTPDTAAVYPGQVIWEGTNISEGRGTTLPFELFGAPFINTDELKRNIEEEYLLGCCLRPLVFEPTSGKWANQSCNGFQIHITNRNQFKPYRTSLALFQAIYLLYPEQFSYKEPPYEYEYELLPMDLILGDEALRKNLENGVSLRELEASWQDDLDQFCDVRQQYLLY